MKEEEAIVSYDGLYEQLKRKGITKTDLTSEIGISSRTIAKIAKTAVTVNDVIELHAEFEYIHPFQDGNGRVERLVALKECLHHNIIPFIIEDAKKHFYYRGLSEWRNEKGWLTDTCLDGQDTFIRLLDMLDIPHQ